MYVCECVCVCVCVEMLISVGNVCGEGIISCVSTKSLLLTVYIHDAQRETYLFCVKRSLFTASI